MKTAKIVVIAAAWCVFAAGAASVETGQYLTGAWGYPSTPEWRELYRQGGLNLVGYNPNLVEWAKEHREFARAFESFPADADLLYPGWRQALGVAGGPAPSVATP